jgi:hypothetical protein
MHGCKYVCSMSHISTQLTAHNARMCVCVHVCRSCVCVRMTYVFVHMPLHKGVSMNAYICVHVCTCLHTPSICVSIDKFTGPAVYANADMKCVDAYARIEPIFFIVKEKDKT